MNSKQLKEARQDLADLYNRLDNIQRNIETNEKLVQYQKNVLKQSQARVERAFAVLRGELVAQHLDEEKLADYEHALSAAQSNLKVNSETARKLERTINTGGEL